MPKQPGATWCKSGKFRPGRSLFTAIPWAVQWPSNWPCAIPKPPGKPADYEDPILLPRGSTVLDMARAIHRDLPDQFKRARQWHDGRAGAWAARDHVVEDMEVLELES